MQSVTTQSRLPVSLWPSLLGVTFAGLWADHIGVKKIVTLAIITVGIGSLIAGFAPNIHVLTLGRSVQGFALGIDLVTMYVVIGRMYPEALRPKALGMLAAAWVVPGLVGPGIAGLMVEVSSWRMTFWIVPLLLILPSVVLLSQLDKLQTAIPQPRTDSKSQIIAALAAVLALALFQFSTSRIGHVGCFDRCCNKRCLPYCNCLDYSDFNAQGIPKDCSWHSSHHRHSAG